MARRGEQVDTLSHPVLLPPVPFEGEPGTVWIDTASVIVPAERWALPDEELAMAFRGAPGMQAVLAARSGSMPMPTRWWLRPVESAARVGEHIAVVWKALYAMPASARRWGSRRRTRTVPWSASSATAR